MDSTVRAGSRVRKPLATGRNRASRRDSPTVTLCSLQVFFIDNWRWEGVPFYLRAGKAMAKRVTEIAIQFKRPPLLLFKGSGNDAVSPNVLAMRLQPDEECHSPSK